MTTFLLILSIWGGHGSVATAAGFATKAECEAAGELWLQQYNGHSYSTAKGEILCVPQTKAQ